jgi:hypothetical protein
MCWLLNTIGLGAIPWAFQKLQAFQHIFISYRKKERILPSFSSISLI